MPAEKGTEMSQPMSQLTCLAATGRAWPVLAFLGITLVSVLLIWAAPSRKWLTRVAIYVHELSHGVAALVSGGRFVRFHVEATRGVCVCTSHNASAVTSAGYLGAFLLGAVLLALSACLASPGWVVCTMGILMGLSVFKAGDAATAGTGLVLTTTFWLCATLLPNPWILRWVINLFGVILLWEGAKSLRDLYGMTAPGACSRTDAHVLAALTGRSARFWAVVLASVGVLAGAVILWLAVC